MFDLRSLLSFRSPAIRRWDTKPLALERLEDRAVPAALVQTDLYFGRNISTGGQVSEAQFQQFIDTVVTPRFPDGLTLQDARGQFLDDSNTLVVEPSKLLTLFREDTPAEEKLVNEVIAAYLTQFHQESVLEATNRDNLSVNFDTGDLYPNSSSLIQVDLYFGRNIAGGGQVSEAQFQSFIDTEVTPRFPDGLTLLDAKGQFRDSAGDLIVEPSKLLTLITDGGTASEDKVNEIIDAYRTQFMQESVLTAANTAVGVSFGDPADDLFANPATPHLIQADLYFGRNISGGGQVSEAQFQNFIDTEVTPRFPLGLTLFDARGQFLDSTSTLVVEPSKLLTLFVDDTTDNEAKMHEVIEAYKTQFSQESVLVVVDDTEDVSFSPQATAEPVAVAAGPNVHLFAQGQQTAGFAPYVGYAGAVDVAQADVNGDGVLDTITGTVTGADHVKVFDGVTGKELYSFLAFGGYGGGVSVGAADLNGDGFADIIVGAGPGAPGGHVKVFDGATGALTRSFLAFDGFTGGVTVAGGEGFLVVGAMAGAPGGHVKVFDGATGALLRSFFAFDGFTGGVSVAAGDLDGDGFGDVIVGAGPGAPGGHVKVFDGRTGVQSASFFAYDNFQGGVRVAARDTDGDLRDELFTVQGPFAAPLVERYGGDGLALLDKFFVDGPVPLTGAFVG